MEPSSDTVVYRKPEGVVMQSIAEELILLNNATETYFSLDSVGAFMYESLTGGNGIQAVVDSVCAAFEGAEPAVVRGDADELVAELEQRSLLERIDG